MTREADADEWMQKHCENFNGPIVLDEGDEKTVGNEGGVGNRKKHKVTSGTSTTATKSSSSSSFAPAPKVKQRILEKHDSTGSDCKRNLDDQLNGAADMEDIERDDEFLSNAQRKMQEVRKTGARPEPLQQAKAPNFLTMMEAMLKNNSNTNNNKGRQEELNFKIKPNEAEHGQKYQSRGRLKEKAEQRWLEPTVCVCVSSLPP